MFDDTFSLLIIAAASIAAASASCIPLLIPRILPEASHDVDESWRDQAPKLFRLSRWGLKRFTNYVDERMTSKKHESLTDRLNEAGLSYAITPAEVEVVRWLVATLAGLLAIYFVLTYSLYDIKFILPLLCLPPLGYFYLDIWLRDAAKRRKQSIEKHFPFFLDVVVLSMKAGLAFPAAIQQATMRLPDSAIKQELGRFIREVRTGVSRSAGLERLAKRIRLASVSNFVAVVAQADESGGSLTTSLNEQARQRRRERFQRAEKLANQAPVKMLFPLVAFLFPVTFMIIGFPIYGQIADSGLF